MKIVDNFLSEQQNKEILDIFTRPNFPWFLCNEITEPGAGTKLQGIYGNQPIIYDNLFYMVHVLQNENHITSNYYEPIILKMFLPKMDVKALRRVKANFYPSSNEVHEHLPHADNPWPHKGALYYINDNDGYTIIGDEKVESVANRMVFFDPSIKHASTDCSNARYRLNINFNYF